MRLHLLGPVLLGLTLLTGPVLGTTPASASAPGPASVHRGPAPVTTTDTLSAGEALVAGTAHDRLTNGWYELSVLSAYVSLVETIPVAGRNGTTATSTGTWFRTDPGGDQPAHDSTVLALRRTGDLVLRTASGRRLWHSATAGSGAVRLTLHRGGGLSLHRRSGTVVWRSGSGQVQMSGGMTLGSGERLSSAWETAFPQGGRITLTMQHDGNLVHRCGSRIDWQTHTGVRGSVLRMDTAGVLRVVTPKGRTAWVSHSRPGHDQASLNGQFMEVTAAGGQRVWSARAVSGVCS